MLKIDGLLPFLAFTHLTEVNLIAPGGFDLDDDDIKVIAKAWPRVTELTLGSSELELYLHPRLSLYSLISIAEFCPDTCRLWIAVDASVIPPISARGGEEGIRNHSLVTLGVKGSPIESAVDVAAFLSDLFPNIVNIGLYSEFGMQNEETRRTGRLWDEVDDLLSSVSAEHDDA